MGCVVVVVGSGGTDGGTDDTSAPAGWVAETATRCINAVASSARSCQYAATRLPTSGILCTHAGGAGGPDCSQLLVAAARSCASPATFATMTAVGTTSTSAIASVRISAAHVLRPCNLAATRRCTGHNENANTN